ncbi:MAG: site-specific integrase [Colwellia sp.]|nr:site-specific integrase [Colwellia sp.]
MENILNKLESNPVESFLLNLGSHLTAETYRIVIKVFCEFAFKNSDFDNIDWSKLNHISVLKFIRYKSTINAHTTVNLYLTIIKGLSKQCWQYSLISIENYMLIQSVKKMKGHRNRAGRALKIDEINKALQYFDASKTNQRKRDCAIFALGCGAGLRRREISSLDIENIDTKSLSVIGKGNKERIVYLSVFVRKSLREWIKCLKRQKGALFVRIDKADNLSDKRLRYGGIHLTMYKISRESKIKKFTAHDLRRTFATLLLDSKADRFAVQHLMGHSSLATTELYDRRGDKAMIEAIKLLPF